MPLWHHRTILILHSSKEPLPCLRSYGPLLDMPLQEGKAEASPLPGAPGRMHVKVLCRTVRSCVNRKIVLGSKSHLFQMRQDQGGGDVIL